MRGQRLRDPGISRQRRWALAAAAWALLFAIPSFYWAAGGDFGRETIAADDDALGAAGEPVVVALTGVAKVVGALLAIGLAAERPPISQRWLRWLALFMGVGLLLYGGASFVQHGLMVSGAIDTPEALGNTAARWHFFAWDPWWLLGGLLFIAASRARR